MPRELLAAHRRLAEARVAVRAATKLNEPIRLYTQCPSLTTTQRQSVHTHRQASGLNFEAVHSSAWSTIHTLRIAYGVIEMAVRAVPTPTPVVTGSKLPSEDKFFLSSLVKKLEAEMECNVPIPTPPAKKKDRKSHEPDRKSHGHI